MEFESDIRVCRPVNLNDREGALQRPSRVNPSALSFLCAKRNKTHRPDSDEFWEFRYGRAAGIALARVAYCLLHDG